MKKLLTKILIGVFAVITMLGCFAGCSSSASWGGTTMNAWDKDASIVGGFIGEKGDYLYYINGVGVSTEDNTFGAPVKGALMAATKDFSKTEVVVPKLFVASDYKAGLYIYGDYVYYGTPNTDKNSKGDIANNELTFMRTKLDGTDSKTFFTLSSLAAEYRIVEKEDVVYIVYYDSIDTALEAYNCSTGETVTIAKTDAEAEVESLNAYKFAENGSDVVVYYTTTVYDEAYNANKEEERATANYNKVYAYKAGDNVNEQKAILDGLMDGENERDNPATYEIKMVKLGVMFYAETINGTATTYAYGIPGKITNTAALADTTLFTETGIYILTEGVIAETGLQGNYNKNVAINTGATALLAVNEGYIYFTDAESGISRIKLNDQDANIEKVTEGTAFTSWYPVQFIGGKMFYCDNSSQGASYIKYVDVSAENAVKGKDTDDDGKEDKFYLEGQTGLGLITEADKISIATAKVNAIANVLKDGVLPFEADKDGNLYVSAVDKATDAVKGLEVSEDTLALLANYQKAVEMANYYEKLEGIRYETTKSYETEYNDVKGAIEAFRASEDYTAISAYIGNNRLANYDQAKKAYDAK